MTERQRFEVREWDIIPLPDKQFSKKRPVKRTVRDHPAWPNRAFTLYFDWNESFSAWVWRVELAGRMDDETLVERQPVRYADPYTFRDMISFLFVDFSRREQEITPRNLGSDVELIAIPERRSPGFESWADKQKPIEETEVE